MTTKSEPSAQPSAPWLVFRHVAHEHIGTLAEILAEAGIEYRYLDVFRGEAVPANLSGSLGLIVMGGPMGVYEADRYPFLREEQRLIRQAAEAGLPVLGICLGSQLIAAALGGRAYPGPRKEIGWYPVEVTMPEDEFAAELPARFMAFHWHGDTFDLPPGAKRLFRSDLYENQGFRWGRNVLAIQFHVEINPAMVDEWLADGGCQRELAAASDADPKIIRQQTVQWAGELQTRAAKIFRRFLSEPRP